MISDEEIASLKARAEVATPGPWHVETGDTMYSVLAPFVSAPLKGQRQKTLLAGVPNAPDGMANAWFIALSREWMPKLIGEVIQLRAHNMGMEKILRRVATVDPQLGCIYGCGAGGAQDYHAGHCPIWSARKILGLPAGPPR